MPPIIPNTVAEVRIVGELHGSQCINVWHVASSQVYPDFDSWETALLALANAMLQCALDLLLPAVSSDYRLDHVDAKMLYPTQTDAFVASAASNSIGTAGDTNVSFAAVLVNLRTGRDGRRGRGRKFLPPPGDEWITNSILDGAKVGDFVEFLNCVVTKFVGADATSDWRLGVLSRKDLTGPGGNYGTAFKEVQQLTPSSVIACLRSRKKGVGS